MNFQLFPALIDHPQKTKFERQEDDEVIELLLRAHWVTNMPWVVVAIVGFVAPFFLPVIAPIAAVKTVLQAQPEVLMVTVILWDMLFLAFVIERFLYWYFNIYIVTNKHLVDINFHNLLKHDTVEVRLSDVESMKKDISGVIKSLFHFGDLIIETAAQVQDIEFTNVPKPSFVADRIQDLQEATGGAGPNE